MNEVKRVGPPTIERRNSEQRISDEELGNLIAAFGNSESKGLTLLVLNASGIQTRDSLGRKMSEIQGPQTGWMPKDNQVFTYYCQQSLAPIGLAAKELTDPEGHTWGYKITDYGSDVGVPLAGLLLDFSLRHGRPLYHYFGRTQSVAESKEVDTQTGTIKVKKRSPMERVRIFWELLTSKLPIKEKDLGSHLKTPTMVMHHLRDLDNYGIIHYDAIEREKPFANFRLLPDRPSDPPTPAGTAIALGEAIYDILQTQPDVWLTRDQVRQLYLKKYPEKTSLSQNALLVAITRTLAHFTRQGYLERQKFGDFTQSEVNLSEDQRAVLYELVELLDRFQQLDPQILEEGRQKAAAIFSNPDQVAALMAKAGEASPDANKTSLETTEQRIVGIISNSPIIDSKAILEELHVLGQRIGFKRVSTILKGLKRSGKIELVNSKGVSHWALPDSKDDITENNSTLSKEDISNLADEILVLYSEFFDTEAKPIPTRIIANMEEAFRYLTTTVGWEIPRGYITFKMQPIISADGKSVSRIQGFLGPHLTFVMGDPKVVADTDPVEIYTEILTHELIHGQVVPLAVVGTEFPPLTPQDLDYDGHIDYVTGFKAIFADPQLGVIPITKPFNEFTTQYLSMSLLGSFDRPSDSLLAMRANESDWGKGIDRELILGAEHLNSLFASLGISSKQIEQFYRNSDIRGLINLVVGIRDDIRSDFIKLITQPDYKSCLSFLESLIHKNRF